MEADAAAVRQPNPVAVEGRSRLRLAAAGEGLRAPRRAAVVRYREMDAIVSSRRVHMGWIRPGAGGAVAEVPKVAGDSAVHVARSSAAERHLRPGLHAVGAIGIGGRRLVVEAEAIGSLRPGRDLPREAAFAEPNRQRERNGRLNGDSRRRLRAVPRRADHPRDPAAVEAEVLDAIARRLPQAPRHCVFRRVQFDAEDVLDQHGDGPQAAPAHEVRDGVVAWRDDLRRVVLPDRARMLIERGKAVHVVLRNRAHQGPVALSRKAPGDHVGGRRPTRPLPVFAGDAVAVLVRGKRGHHHGPPESVEVHEVVNKMIGLATTCHFRDQGPERRHSLGFDHAPLRVRVVALSSVVARQRTEIVV